ncbi:23S rRNA (pseudouridine(1915)-N(3))-methyltransferase RlmH [Thermoflavifilum thermophilum]|uniref:Ribosomal RNA large subunit methyltransferase H n=1 Tax=Thermoflavifilum thermophilum TaxID=1393122 RepID=A0A1I7NN29_9BACT|nr:23S rRNA (pseudouridine(1915)-N(3))-methyltransferase RlmH [Thermoflavifilum thermophilum]SFV35980.1 23S rRNA (pseudouridine1915-N3)-methyltransferase [Thermoflavifilum thermophilum]
MRIVIWAIAKKTAPGLEEAISEYEERLNRFIPMHTELIPPAQPTTDFQAARRIEADRVLQRLREKDYLVLLDEHGKAFSTSEWAAWMTERQMENISRLIFLIGGAYGVDKQLKQKARLMISLSRLTFPHQLARLILTEQLYRVFTILHHQPYHHES